MYCVKAKIINNKRVVPRFYRMTLSAAKIAKKALAGQFVEIEVAKSDEVLLRRPFGIHNVSDSKIEILYEALGKGTRLLSGRKKGEYLDVIGPLGNGFDLNNKKQVIVVAGGMGVAPLFYLARQLKKKEVTVLIGAKRKQDILCEKDFKKIASSVKIATDDGSYGHKGKVTELLKKSLNKNIPTVIYACGPRPMLKAISKLKIDAQILLEEHLACGIGACLGCVVNTKEGYKRVCKEGPVFKASEIIWR